jgi:hypothetical protein
MESLCVHIFLIDRRSYRAVLQGVAAMRSSADSSAIVLVEERY